MSDIYKRAAFTRLRFQSSQGYLTVEDLAELPLKSSRGNANLDDISKALNKKLKNSDDNFSLIDSETKTDATVQLQFDIVKDIIETRLTERDIKAKEKEEADRKQKIRGVIAAKKDQQLQDMPLSELEKLL